MSAREWAPLRAVHVVVPAHDEEQHVGALLTSVLLAAHVLRTAHPHLDVSVTLVLDRCTDATGSIAASLGVDCLDVDAGCVGVARGAGVRHVVALHADLDPGTVLVANTDADCVVPPTWLLDLADLAVDHDLVQGEIEPDPTDLTPAALAAWWERHPRGRGSLHGANLAFRLDAYLRAGGFPPVPDQEDLLLVRAMKADGATAVGGTRVLTSGRRDGRVPRGFAGYLRALDVELAGPGD